MAIGLVIVAVLVVAVVLLMTAVRFGPVKRERLERFAERAALPITPTNGNLVIRYLGLTRRWRTLGLLTGVAASIAWSLRQGQVNVDLFLGFMGWFIGAVIAEYEFSVIKPGQRRVASLQPRLLHDRLSRSALIWPLVIVAVALGCAGILIVTGAVHGGVEPWPVAGYLALTGACVGVPALVARHVLSRAQPLDLAPDIRDADDALRHRSLHVLAGCAVALTCGPAGGLAAMVADRFAGPDPELGQEAVPTGFFVLAFILIFVPVLGFLIGRTRRTPEPVEMSRTA